MFGHNEAVAKNTVNSHSPLYSATKNLSNFMKYARSLYEPPQLLEEFGRMYVNLKSNKRFIVSFWEYKSTLICSESVFVSHDPMTKHNDQILS